MGHLVESDNIGVHHLLFQDVVVEDGNMLDLQVECI
jgi:hypothetical protein